MNKFRRNSLLMVLLIIIIIVISIFSLYSAYKVNKGKNNNKDDVIKEKIEEIEEVNIPDSTRTYKTLDQGIEVINYLYTSLDNKITSIYRDEVNISDIEDKYKLYSILYYLYNEKKYDNILEEDYNRLYDGLYMEEKKDYYGSINFDDVSSLYKKIYNKTLDTGYEINIENYCPIYKFDANKYFFGIYDCKNENNRLINYKYKYVIGENSADVYVALGVFERDNNFKMYKYDLYKNTPLKESDTDIMVDIDRNNYNEYSKYIVHFVKENGEFYASTIRKVSE